MKILTTYGNLVIQEKVIDGKSFFYKFDEPKWIKFCKEHGFHYINDAYGKIYDLYLVMCGQGLV